MEYIPTFSLFVVGNNGGDDLQFWEMNYSLSSDGTAKYDPRIIYIYHCGTGGAAHTKIVGLSVVCDSDSPYEDMHYARVYVLSSEGALSCIILQRSARPDTLLTADF